MGPPPALEAASDTCFGGCCFLRGRCGGSKPQAQQAQPVVIIAEPPLKDFVQQAADLPEPAPSAAPETVTELLEGFGGHQLLKTKWVAAFASAALLAAAVGPPASLVWAGSAGTAVLGIVPIIASLAWALLANKNPSVGGRKPWCENLQLPVGQTGADINAMDKCSYANMEFNMTADEIAAEKWHQQRQQQALVALPTLKALLENERLEDPEGFLQNKLTLLRYLRACNAPPATPAAAHAEAAVGRLRQTLAWRQEALLQGDLVIRKRVEAQTLRYRYSCPCCKVDPMSHCYFPLGLDRRNRLVFYSSAARAANKDLSGIAHIICELEANLGDHSSLGAQQMVWIVDFRGFKTFHTNPRVGYEAIKVFGKHYPERLGQIVLLGFPAAFHFLYQLLHAVLDPVTRQKVRILRRPQDREAYLKTYWPEWMRDWLAAADELPPLERVVLPSLPGGSGDPRVSTASRLV